jgi:hypothetical protein
MNFVDAARYIALAVGILIGCNNSYFLPSTNFSNKSQKKTRKAMENKSKNITLNCQSELEKHELKISYTVTNKSENDIYVLDIIPTPDPDAGKVIYDPNTVYLSWVKPSNAEIIKGVPPLPDMPVNHRIMPVGTKLIPNKKHERVFTLKLPLREQSPYYSLLNEDEYSEAQAKKNILTVHFVRSNIEGFEANTAPNANDLYVLRGKNLVAQIENLQCELDLPTMRLLKRKDWILRN